MTTTLNVKVTELIASIPRYSTSLFTAGLSRYPTTPTQHIIVLHAPYLFTLNAADQMEIMHFAREFAAEIQSMTGVRRCGLAYDGFQSLHVIPMHGLSGDGGWRPIVAPLTDTDMEVDDAWPGYLWTKNGPAMHHDRLNEVQRTICAVSGWDDSKQSLAFHGQDSDDNLFARLIRGEIPQWRVWEDDGYVAFLTPFPNTLGYTVVVPRRHLGSDILGLEVDELDGLMRAAREVVRVLQGAMGTGRVGMFFEGFEIDYAHVKLVPVLGVDGDGDGDGEFGLESEGPSEEFHEVYPGYLSTRLGPEVRL